MKRGMEKFFIRWTGNFSLLFYFVEKNSTIVSGMSMWYDEQFQSRGTDADSPFDITYKWQINLTIIVEEMWIKKENGFKIWDVLELNWMKILKFVLLIGFITCCLRQFMWVLTMAKFSKKLKL